MSPGLRRRLAAAAVSVVAGFAASAPALFAAPARPSAPPAAAKKPPATLTRTVEAVLLAFDKPTKAVRLQPSEAGAAPIVAILDADCRFITGGRTVEGMDEFSQGQPVVARLTARAAFGGAIFLRTLWDSPSYKAEKERRTSICVGTVEAATIGSIDVRRAVDDEVIAFRLSDKTVVVRDGAPAAYEAYPVGAAVAVKPRALPSGGLMASIIGKSAQEVEFAHHDTLTLWRGELVAVEGSTRGDSTALLVIRRDDGAPRKVYVSIRGTVKVGGKPVLPQQLPPGSEVRLHLIKGEWKDGMRSADEVSVPKRRKKAGTPAAPGG